MYQPSSLDALSLDFGELNILLHKKKIFFTPKVISLMAYSGAIRNIQGQSPCSSQNWKHLKRLPEVMLWMPSSMSSFPMVIR